MSISNVLVEYERIREKNEVEEQRRKSEVYQKIPNIGEIYFEIKELQKKRILEAVSGRDEYKNQIQNLINTAHNLLVKAGFPIDYLDPIYSCDICRDTGFMPNGERCNCFKKLVLEDKLSEAQLIDSGISFENFDINVFDDEPIIKGKSQKDEMIYYKQLTESYANSYPNCLPIMILSGAIGLGKTYIAKCIMHRVIERGYTAAFYTAYRIFSIFHKDRLGEEVDMAPIFEVPLLIIDDLGTEPMTRNVTIQYFFNLINERCMAGLHTLIVTNLTLDEIKIRYGERIHSRLMDKNASVKIQIEGNDIRVPNKA